MNDSWDERRRAQEEQYFQKQNEQALKRIKEREQNTTRLSPVTGKQMEQLTLMGVVIDRCKDTGGIWLDAGELEQIIESSKTQGNSNWLSNLMSMLSGKSS